MRVASLRTAHAKPGVRVNNSEIRAQWMRKSFAIMCWFGLVWFGSLNYNRSGTISPGGKLKPTLCSLCR